jgi:tetratricopeptide (TPR) repeat protein
LKPDFEDAYVALANTLSSNGNYNEAIRNYDSAIKLNPQNPTARNNLGVAYLSIGKNKEGLAAFKDAAALNPSIGEIHVNLARAYLRLRNKEAALAEYTALQTSDSELAKTIYDEIFQRRILRVNH